MQTLTEMPPRNRFDTVQHVWRDPLTRAEAKEACRRYALRLEKLKQAEIVRTENTRVVIERVMDGLSQEQLAHYYVRREQEPYKSLFRMVREDVQTYGALAFSRGGAGFLKGELDIRPREETYSLTPSSWGMVWRGWPGIWPGMEIPKKSKRRDRGCPANKG